MSAQALLKQLNLKHLLYLFAIILLVSKTTAQEAEPPVESAEPSADPPAEPPAASPVEYSYDYKDYIKFHWKGALTSHSVTFKVFPYVKNLGDTGFYTYLASYTIPAVVGSPEDLADEIKGFDDANVTLVVDKDNIVEVATVVLDNLNPNSLYHYSFFFTTEPNVTNDIFKSEYKSTKVTEFTFNTFGIALTPFNFTFGASCCAQTNSTSRVFDILQQQDLDFFLHLGDMHYENIIDNDTAKFSNAYQNVFSSTKQKDFLQAIPIFYVWDDSDFGGSNGKSPTRYAASYAYDKYVPHKKLKDAFPRDDAAFFPNGEAPEANYDKSFEIYEPSTDIYGIFQSFIVGRCLFIIMDLRSYKDIEANDILGTEQTSWLKNQLRFVSTNPNIKQVILVSSIPWIHTAGPTEWSAYEATQKTISGWVKEFVTGTKKNLLMVSGHAHMVAFDSGKRNYVYGGFPVAQAGALDQDPSCEGGPYSHGLYRGREQFGVFDIIDANDTVCVFVSLERAGEPQIIYNTCHPENYMEQEMTCPIDSFTETIIKGASSYWVIIVIGIGLAIILGFLGVKAYKTYGRGEASEDRAEDVTKYMEMTPKGNNQLP